MNIEKIANSGALKTRPYVAGKSKKEVMQEFNLSSVIKMASNENPGGSSPLARKALEKIADQVHLYPDPVNRELRSKLAGRLSVSEDQITVGNGADGVIYNLGMAVIGQGDEIILPELTFAVYETIIRIMRGEPVFTRMDGLRIDLDHILDHIGNRTKAVFLCNPNNPTGDALPPAEVEEFLNRVPEHILCIVDEAYIDFTPQEYRPDTFGIFRRGKRNLFIKRTYSKIYGLAGLRIGYGVGDSGLINLIHRVKPPFDVSIAAEYCALQALDDRDFYRETLQQIDKEKAYFYRELDSLGISYIPTYTNFLLIDVGDDTVEISKKLMKRGVIVRPMNGYGLPTSIRVTLGLHQENVAFFKALREVLNR